MKKLYYLLMFCAVLSCKEDDGIDEPNNGNGNGSGCSQETKITFRTSRKHVYTGETLALYSDATICRGAVKSISVNGVTVNPGFIANDSLNFVIPPVTGDSASIAVMFTDFTVSLSKKIAVFAGGGTWKEVQSFPGAGRIYTTGFTMDGKAYVLGGVDARSNAVTDATGVFAYDPNANLWQKTFDGVDVRASSTNTPAANGLLYRSDVANEFNYYNAQTNTVSPIAGPSFAANSLGFILDGSSCLVGRRSGSGLFYIIRYNQSSKLWENVIETEITKDDYWVSNTFIVGGKVYVTIQTFSSMNAKLVVYDPAAQTVTWLSTLNLWAITTGETWTVSVEPLFTIGKLAYFKERGLYTYSSDNNNDVIIQSEPASRMYIYNTVTDEWHVSKMIYPSKFMRGTSFTINGRGFAGLGMVKKTESSVTYPQNFYEFIPQ